MSAKRLEQIADAQRETESFLWEQSEQIKVQQSEIERLAGERQILADQLTELRERFESIQSRQPESVTAKKSRKREVQARLTEKSESLRDGSGKLVIGREEWVWFDLFRSSTKTRIDTGLKSSVIYASGIRLLERDGEEWVRFTYSAPEWPLEAGSEKVFEAPVVKKIRSKSSQNGDSNKRVVVSLRVKLGDLVEDSLFVLSDKNGESHGIVLGRSFLQDVAVVDVSKTFTQSKFNKQ